VLFDPFEEQFNLPATAIQFGHSQGWQSEVIGKKNQILLLLIIEVFYPEEIGSDLLN
jgi:hypothetical protein